ncbi:MAG: hypothetical protein ABIO70_13915 [Pseudomonadota bacterium]
MKTAPSSPFLSATHERATSPFPPLGHLAVIGCALDEWRAWPAGVAGEEVIMVDVHELIRKHLLREAEGPPVVRAVMARLCAQQTIEWCRRNGQGALEEGPWQVPCALNTASYLFWHHEVRGARRGPLALQGMIYARIDDQRLAEDVSHRLRLRVMNEVAGSAALLQVGRRAPEFRRGERAGEGLDTDYVTIYHLRGVPWEINHARRGPHGLRHEGALPEGPDAPTIQEAIEAGLQRGAARSDDAVPAVPPTPEEVFEASMRARALRFALLWYLCDREGGVWKDKLVTFLAGMGAGSPCPALRLPEGVTPPALPGNDKGHLLDGLSARLYTTLGLEALLGARERSGLSLPSANQITYQDPAGPVRALIASLKEALPAAITHTAASDHERAALRAVLVDGSHLAGQRGKLPGASPAEQRARFFELCEQVGGAVSRTLQPPGGDHSDPTGPGGPAGAPPSHGGGDGRGGLPCGHDAQRRMMRAYATGGLPSPEVFEAEATLLGCEACRAWWREYSAGAALEALAPPEAEAEEAAVAAPTEVRASGLARWWRRLALAVPVLAVVATVLLLTVQPPPAVGPGTPKAGPQLHSDLDATVFGAAPGGPAPAALHNGSTVLSGSTFAISLAAGRPGSLYLVYRAPGAAAELLLPAGGQGSFPWRGAEGFLVDPGSPGGDYYEHRFTRDAGPHTLQLVVLPAPLSLELAHDQGFWGRVLADDPAAWRALAGDEPEQPVQAHRVVFEVQP